MAITLVASIVPTTTSHTVPITKADGTQGTATVYDESLSVPASVAVGDILVISGYSTNGGTYFPSGWTVLARGNNNVVAWSRWQTGNQTSIGLNAGYWYAPFGMTIWRGVQGFRDVASIQYPQNYSQPPPRSPAVSQVIGDKILISYSGNLSGPSSGGQGATATNPASIVCISGVPFISYDTATTTSMSLAYVSNSVGLDVPLATVISLCLPIAPLSANVTYPASGLTADFTTANNSVTWNHNKAGVDGSGSGAQNAYALRRKIGVGAYEYWNAGSAVWGPIVWNVTTLGSVTFPAGQWINNTTYDISVATQENASNLQGPFGNSVSLTVHTPPIVTVTGPV